MKTTIIYAIASAEYKLFKATGIILPILRIKWDAESQHIQRMLNSQHIEVFCPPIVLD